MHMADIIFFDTEFDLLFSRVWYFIEALPTPCTILCAAGAEGLLSM